MTLKIFNHKFKIVNIFNFILGTVIGLLFINVDLKTEDVQWIKISLILLSVTMIFIICKGINYKPISKLYFFLLISIGITSFMVDEISVSVGIIFVLVSYYYLFNLKESVFFAFVLGNCFSGLRLLISCIINILNGNAWQGNRVPLHITIIGLLALYLVNEKFSKKILTYIILVIILLVDFFAQSRTAFLSCCIAFALQLIIDMRGRLTVKKLILVLFSLCIVFSILYTFQNDIVSLLFNKWGIASENNLTSGRTDMWMDVLSDLRLFGYGSDYSLKRYGVQNIHNGYIQAYVSYGLFVGIIYIVWKLIYTINLVVLNKNKKVANLLVIMIPLLFFNAFESMFLLDPSYPYMGFLDVLLMGRSYQTIIESKAQNKKLSKIKS